MKQGVTAFYDPFGNLIAGTVLDNVSGGLDNGWLGQHQRPVESAAGLQATIEMGARPYNPILGRFLGVDPVEGGTPNAYMYVDDPVNEFDLNGQWGWPKIPNPIKAVKKAASAVGGAVASAGRAVGRAAAVVGKTAWKYRGWIAVGLAVAGMFGSPVCAIAGYAATAYSAASTASSCVSRQWTGCAVGVASLGLGFAGTRVWRAGKSLNKAGRFATAQPGFRNILVRGGGWIDRGVGRAQMIGGKGLGWGSVGLDTCSAAGGCS